jgi:hypothetical protein
MVNMVCAGRDRGPFFDCKRAAFTAFTALAPTAFLNWRFSMPFLLDSHGP